jgi:hypothetical protein
MAQPSIDDPTAAFIYEPGPDAVSRSGMTIREVEAWVIRSPHPAVGEERLNDAFSQAGPR